MDYFVSVPYSQHIIQGDDLLYLREGEDGKLAFVYRYEFQMPAEAAKILRNAGALFPRTIKQYVSVVTIEYERDSRYAGEPENMTIYHVNDCIVAKMSEETAMEVMHHEDNFIKH